MNNSDGQHIVPKLDHKVRLSDFGTSIFQQLQTKSAWKKAIKKKAIFVDGDLGTYGKYLFGGETLTLQIPEKKEPRRKLVFPLEVLYEDQHLALVHKRSGILVSGNSFFTIDHALEQNLKKSEEPSGCKPLPVHRLDYNTTGLVLVGKTNSSIRKLYKQFENKEIQKVYYAITIELNFENANKLKKEGRIDSPIDDKRAVTDFTLLDTVSSSRFGRLNLLKLEPKTGRRHQLRKHLSGIGQPILGDQEYGVEELILTKKGVYLHAFSLSFIHPITGKKMIVHDENLKRFQKIFPEAFL